MRTILRSLPCLVLAVLATAFAKEPDPPATLDIQCERGEGDAVQVETAGGKTVLRVTSRRGIGSATITRIGDQWPKELVLRVHLTGLEQLSLTSGDVRLSASVLSHGDHARLLHLRTKEKEEQPVTKESPYWMEITAYNAQGQPIAGLPDKGGWFEMVVPRALLADQEKVLKVNWVDFFRG